jgi:two-component system, NarL family, sensor kinase
LDLTSLIIMGIAAMLVLAMGIILFVLMYQRRIITHQLEIKKINEQKQLELIQASIQGEEEERMRIASELHDDIGATLSSIRLFLSAAAQDPSDTDIIHQSKELLDDSIGKIRNISHKLQPSTLYHLGLQTSFQALSDMISKSGAISMEYISISELPRLHESIELSAYRIIQELVNNTLKHAGAKAIVLKTDIGDEGLKLSLSHNGYGITQEMYQELIYKKGAIGLKNIVNRLKSVNASIQFLQENEKWYRIEVVFPVVYQEQIISKP